MRFLKYLFLSVAFINIACQVYGKPARRDLRTVTQPDGTELRVKLVGDDSMHFFATEEETEFFLLENRQLIGWDSYLPGHGMLIWHIDYDPEVFGNNEVNNLKTHQYVDIVEANNNPNNYDYKAMAGWTFPGTTNVTSFTSTTKPALKDWNGNPIDFPITDITEKDLLITFKVKGGAAGIEGIFKDLEDNETNYYNLQGLKIDNPTSGSVVVERKGNITRKILVP